MHEKCAGYFLLQYEIDGHRSLVFRRKSCQNVGRESMRVPELQIKFFGAVIFLWYASE